MAASRGKAEKDSSSSDVDLLLHPELLSRDFLKLILNEKRVSTGDCGSGDGLKELYLRHVIPLPQRALPDSRWGRRVEKSRGSAVEQQQQRSHGSSSNDQNRKRPPIVFDGPSSHSRPFKVKKPEGSAASAGITDRLKPPPAANLTNPIRKLSDNHSPSAPRSSDAANLKREADDSVAAKSPDLKKKIQHVTWP